MYPTPSETNSPAAAAGSSPSSGEPALPAEVRRLRRPGHNGIGKAVARGDDPAEVLRLGRSDANEVGATSVGAGTGSTLRRNDIQPQPGSSPRSRSQSASSAGCASRSNRDVAGDIVADRLERRVQNGLGCRLVDAEADDLVQHRAQRRGLGPEDGDAADLGHSAPRVEAAIGVQ